MCLISWSSSLQLAASSSHRVNTRRHPVVIMLAPGGFKWSSCWLLAISSGHRVCTWRHRVIIVLAPGGIEWSSCLHLAAPHHNEVGQLSCSAASTRCWREQVRVLPPLQLLSGAKCQRSSTYKSHQRQQFELSDHSLAQTVRHSLAPIVRPLAGLSC